MIDIQRNLRNQGALNLFDGKGVKPSKDVDTVCIVRTALKRLEASTKPPKTVDPVWVTFV